MRRGLLLVALIFGISSQSTAKAGEHHHPRNGLFFNDPFIFVEGGVTFAVYPDGEFDFYMDQRVQFGVNAGNVGITFNTGYDYNPFVQYDHYGAVIQVENVPIYYDAWGRVDQIGNVNIFYRNGWVNRIGGLQIYYSNGIFSHSVGFINIYNRRYIFRPWHRYFVRPAFGFCNVWATPYRLHYAPVRYTWYRPYIDNRRTVIYNVGTQREYRAIRNRDAIYRNDSRVAQVRSSRSERYAHTGRTLAYNDGARSSTSARSTRSVSAPARTTRSSTTRSTSSGVKNNRTGTVNRSSRSTTSRQSSGTVNRSSRSTTSRQSSGTVNRSSGNSGSNRSYAPRSNRSSNSGIKSGSGSSSRTKSVTRSSAPRKSSSVSAPKRNSMGTVSRSSTVRKSGNSARSSSTSSSRSSSSRSNGGSSRSN